jgi:hypothetical protein
MPDEVVKVVILSKLNFQINIFLMSFVDTQVVHMKNCPYILRCLNCLMEKYMMKYEYFSVIKHFKEVSSSVIFNGKL